MTSKYLSTRQVKGILKVGDIIIPGDEELPKFSETDFLIHIDRIMDYMSKDDLNGFRFLMTFFGLGLGKCVGFIIGFLATGCFFVLTLGLRGGGLGVVILGCREARVMFITLSLGRSLDFF